MLQDILETHTAFKLVCGAGNEDIAEVEKLVTIYSLAGCQFFDISANLEVVEAAKRGLKNAGILENRYLCVSVGISGDPHIQKAVIDQEKCRKCGKCKLVCPHNAIIELDKLFDEKRLDIILLTDKTNYAAFTGFPGLSLPIGPDDNGHPACSCWISRRFDEAQMLAIAYQVEKLLGKRFAPKFN